PVGSGNAEFDAAFEISTSSAGDFRQLITADFMHALMSIRGRISRKIVLTVSGGRMFVFLTGKQSVLRPNLFKKYDEALRSAAAAELNTAGLFIDAFGSPENGQTK
ncbi:MAG: DUF3137 domain-containing protein, partial [Lachnospiraceae bacterium]|nr:DUF3137 domain-containing protein [Lachnospiraceae bacterium]